MKHQIKTELIRGYCAWSLKLSRRSTDRGPQSQGPASRTPAL